MNSQEKEIKYSTTNTYSSLNRLSAKTKTVWFVCHGMGHLSRYFIRHFSILKEEENYILAPQAQSKYYIPPKGKHIGASWLTRENTIAETRNVFSYFDSILEKEKLPDNININFLGYSQGVSVAMRYVASRKISINKLVMVSGGIPVELSKNDFSFCNNSTKPIFIYGTEDEYLNNERIKKETLKLEEIFKGNAQIHAFNGSHNFDFEKVLSLI